MEYENRFAEMLELLVCKVTLGHYFYKRISKNNVVQEK